MELVEVEHMSSEVYLESERHSRVRREFHGGIVTSMAGASKAHEIVSGNLFAYLHQHIRGGPCRVYKSDMKVKIKFNREDLFFYPDVMVSCKEESSSDYFVEEPSVIVEVLSQNEYRDRFEKFAIYQQLESLEDYVVVSQNAESPEVTVYSRKDGWEKVKSTEGTFDLPSIDFSWPVVDIYEGL